MGYDYNLLHNVFLQTMPEEIAQKLSDALKEGEAPSSVFLAVKRYLYQHLNEMYMEGFSKRYLHSNILHLIIIL